MGLTARPPPRTLILVQETNHQRKPTTMKIPFASSLLAIGFSAAMAVTGASCEPSTIGGHEVPYGLTCEEDEVIGFDESAEKVEGEDGRMGFPLGCIHIDSIRYPATPPASDVTVCSGQPELCTLD